MINPFSPLKRPRRAKIELVMNCLNRVNHNEKIVWGNYSLSLVREQYMFQQDDSSSSVYRKG